MALLRKILWESRTIVQERDTHHEYLHLDAYHKLRGER